MATRLVFGVGGRGRRGKGGLVDLADGMAG